MKLILASKEKFLIEQNGYGLLEIPKDELNIGFINTALQVVEDHNYLQYMNEYFAMMAATGIDFKQYDIAGKTETEIRNFFADRNVIQVSGGNAFYLLKSIRETAFDMILPQLLADGRIYIGCSAGTYIMCPTIEIAGWKIDRNRFGLTDFTALNYVPFLIKCHYRDQKEEIVEKIKDIRYPLRILRDDQCLVVEGGDITFVGDKEVKI